MLPGPATPHPHPRPPANAPGADPLPPFFPPSPPSLTPSLPCLSSLPSLSSRPQVVKASVPLSEMFNYVSTLRGMSKGRAQYTMQLEKYEVVPSHIQEKIVADAKVAAAS